MAQTDLKTIRVLLVASDPTMADAIRLHLGQAFLIELIDVACTVEGARERIGLLYPDVVLLAEPTSSHPFSVDVFIFCRELSFDYPGLAVVLLLRETAPEMLEAAIDAGARGVVQVKWGTDGWYVLGEQLESRIRQAYDLTSRQRGPQWPLDEVFERRRSVAFVSGKGGVGKSLLAALLALKVASFTADPARNLTPTPAVALLDLDFQRGVQHLLFDIEPRHTFADIARLKQGLDRTSLRVFSHEFRFSLKDERESKLHIVASPGDYLGSRSITADDVANVMSVARNTFDFVIVDTSVLLSDLFWPVIQTCSYVWFVCTPDVLSVYTTRRSIQDIVSNSERDIGERFGVVINRASKAFQVTHEDVRAIFESEGIPVISEIPATYGALEPHVNEGNLIPLLGNAKTRKRGKGKKRKRKPSVAMDIPSGVEDMLDRFLDGVVMRGAPS